MQAILHEVHVPEMEYEGEVFPESDELVLTFTEGTLRVDCPVESLTLGIFREYREKAEYAIKQKAGTP